MARAAIYVSLALPAKKDGVRQTEEVASEPLQTSSLLISLSFRSSNSALRVLEDSQSLARNRALINIWGGKRHEIRAKQQRREEE